MCVAAALLLGSASRAEADVGQRGILPHFSFESFLIDGKTWVRVNRASRLPVVSWSSGDARFGWDWTPAGWRFRRGPDVKLAVQPDGAVRLDGPTGYEVTFRPDGAGGYHAGPALSNGVVFDGYLSATPTGYAIALADDTEWRFDTTGRFVSESDRLGAAVTYGYTTIAGRTVLASATLSDGRTATFEYDTAGRMKRLVEPAGTAHTIAYDASGDISTFTTANRVVTITYQTAQNASCAGGKRCISKVASATPTTTVPVSTRLCYADCSTAAAPKTDRVANATSSADGSEPTTFQSQPATALPPGSFATTIHRPSKGFRTYFGVHDAVQATQIGAPVSTTAPGVAAWGPLRNAANDYLDGDGIEQIFLAAGATAGVQTLALEIDGQARQSRSLTCASGAPCQHIPAQFDVDTAALAEGRHVARATANTAAAAGATTEWSFTVDRTPPVAATGLRADYDPARQMTMLSWNDPADAALPDGTAGSGIGWAEYRIFKTDGTWGEWREMDPSEPGDVARSAGESVRFAVRHGDNAGNVSAASEATLIVGSGPLPRAWGSSSEDCSTANPDGYGMCPGQPGAVAQVQSGPALAAAYPAPCTQNLQVAPPILRVENARYKWRFEQAQVIRNKMDGYIVAKLREKGSVVMDGRNALHRPNVDVYCWSGGGLNVGTWPEVTVTFSRYSNRYERFVTARRVRFDAGDFGFEYLPGREGTYIHYSRYRVSFSFRERTVFGIFRGTRVQSTELRCEHNEDLDEDICRFEPYGGT